MPDNVEKVIISDVGGDYKLSPQTITINSATAYLRGQSIDWSTSLNQTQGQNTLGYRGTCGETSIWRWNLRSQGYSV